MRLINADELMEHVWRDKLDSRELIAEMIEKAPTIKEIPTKMPIDVFEKLISQEPRWIPVSERLPKAGEYIGDVDKYYLVQNEYGDMLVARYTHSEYWEQIYQFTPIADEIIAWRELPQPYEAESEE